MGIGRGTIYFHAFIKYLEIDPLSVAAEAAENLVYTSTAGIFVNV